MTPEQVRDAYTHLYPEIATAAIEGPETVAGKLVYKFVRAIGAKRLIKGDFHDPEESAKPHPVEPSLKTRNESSERWKKKHMAAPIRAIPSWSD